MGNFSKGRCLIMDKNTDSTARQAKGRVLTYRKTGRIRRFTLLAAARLWAGRAAARYGTRWLSLRLER